MPPRIGCCPFSILLTIGRAIPFWRAHSLWLPTCRTRCCSKRRASPDIVLTFLSLRALRTCGPGTLRPFKVRFKLTLETPVRRDHSDCPPASSTSRRNRRSTSSTSRICLTMIVSPRRGVAGGGSFGRVGQLAIAGLGDTVCQIEKGLCRVSRSAHKQGPRHRRTNAPGSNAGVRCAEFDHAVDHQKKKPAGIL
jgi:hypothetical protein